MPSVLVSTFWVLAVIPALLLSIFLVHGRTTRELALRSYIDPQKKATDVVTGGGADRAVPTDLALVDYVVRRYRTHQTGYRYILPGLLFHLVYLVGLYWSAVGFGALLDDQATPLSPLYGAVVVGAAGFMGAVLIVVRHLFWRTVLHDLQPRALTHAASRLLAAVIVAIALVAVLPGSDAGAAQLSVAFGAGLFTNVALRVFERRWREAVGGDTASDESLPISNIDGISKNDELRLWEEGISDAQHLAVEDVETLLIQTNYSLERIIDWKDQAFLYAYTRGDFPKWRQAYARGALDVLGMDATYYDTPHKPGRHAKLVAALAEHLGKKDAVVERFIDSMFNDPRVHQLWAFLTAAYPAQMAEPIVDDDGKIPSPAPASTAGAPPTPAAPAVTQVVPAPPAVAEATPAAPAVIEAAPAVEDDPADTDA